MREVLLVDMALWGALIMLAALIIIRRWRRSHAWVPARGPLGEAPELPGQKMSAPKTASVTALGKDARAPDGAAPRPVRPAPAAPPRPTEAAPRRATEMAHPKARPQRPAARRDSRPTSTGAATPSEQIVSYFDQADRPIADYLAALGWTQQAPAPPVKQQAQIRVLPQGPTMARPAP